MSMTTALESFELQLRAHFKRLADARQQSAQPLFALEHCLNDAALAEMRAHLYASIPRHGMGVSFKHCWLVHAAEHGYKFQGLEFWQSFAKLTPKWSYFGDRPTLRNWFVQFAMRYNGAQPTGEWGQHYTYIAWPITHALLPSDLQVLLAQALYNVRYRLDELIQLEYASVGEVLAKYTEPPTARFKHFLEQRDLVGRVVLALLEREPKEPVIYPPTLARITEDLNAKSEARAWLKDVRRHFDRFRAQLAKPNPRFDLVAAPPNVEEQRVDNEMESSGVLLRPRLQLRRIARDQWEANILVPSFQALVNIKPHLREHLARVRYRLPSHSSALYPGQSLLSGRPVPKKLAKWPAERTPLLEFTAAETLFDRIVKAECQLLPAQLWIFHLAEDGTARHVQGQQVRAGEIYIVVARKEEQLQGLGQRVQLECDGVVAAELRLPAIADAELRSALQRACISLNSCIYIEPIGLRPRQWSDEGVGEWLSTELPMFALTCDYACDAYHVDIAGAGSQVIQRSPGNGATLVALQELSVGHHRVSFSALVRESTLFDEQHKAVASATIDVYVRHPTSWSPDAQLSAAMVVDANPPVPTLDDLLEQRLEIRIDGDVARSATCSVVLLTSSSEQETSLSVLKHQLPITEAIWANNLKTFIKKADETQILNSSRVYVSIQAEDLGEIRIPLHFEPDPLRWAVRKDKTGPVLVLVNEGVTESLSAFLYTFEHPLHPEELDAGEAARGFPLDSCGGLYVASGGTEHAAVVACAQDKTFALDSLRTRVDRTELAAETAIDQLLDRLRLWESARAGTYMAGLKRYSVSKAIRERLYWMLCGSKWVSLESKLQSEPTDIQIWEQLENEVIRHQPSFAISLSRAWCNHHLKSGFDLEKCFRDTVRSFHVATGDALVRTAWVMARKPCAADNTQAVQAATSKEFASLVRGARLLHLCDELQRATIG